MEDGIEGYLLDTDIVISIATADEAERAELLGRVNPLGLPLGRFAICSSSLTEFQDRPGVGPKKVYPVRAFIDRIKDPEDPLLHGIRYITNGRKYTATLEDLIFNTNIDEAISHRDSSRVVALIAVAKVEKLTLITSDPLVPPGFVSTHLITLPEPLLFGAAKPLAD